MKKGLSLAFSIGSALIILSSFNAGSALMMFLLLGVIPGTNVVVSPTLMLEVISLLVGFTLARVANIGLLKLLTKNPQLSHA